MNELKAENCTMKMVDPRSLTPYENNSKKHSQEAIKELADSMAAVGFNRSVSVDDKGTILAGHKSVLAAIHNADHGIDGFDPIPILIPKSLTDSQRRAFVLAENRQNEKSDWDFDMVSSELEALELDGFNIDLTGFDDSFILKQPDEGLTGDDEVHDVPEDPVTVLGDIWLMGAHRLLCGDSTQIDDVTRLMCGELADFCFTSPPYNGETTVGFEKNRPGRMKTKNLYLDNSTDSKTSEEYIQFNVDILNNVAINAADSFVCCYNISYNKKSPDTYIDVAYEAKKIIPLVETIIWEKQMAISLAGHNLTRIVEFVFVLCKGNLKINKEFRESMKNLWKVSNVGANTETHKACFPVELVEKGIRSFAPHGARIIEPFCGSGTTVIAAEKTGCKCYGIELSEQYADVIVNRWQNFTGKQATLEGDGRTFDEIKDERLKEAVNAA